MTTMKSPTTSCHLLIGKNHRRLWLLKRGGEYLLTLFVIITLNFFLPRLIPGDPFTFTASDTDEVTLTYSDAQIEKYKEYYGLDQPLPEQYATYIGNLVRGNLGYSLYYHDDALKIIIQRLPWTLALVLASLLISCLLGLFLGSISAWNRHTAIDRGLYFSIVAFSEIPPFLIGLALLFYFAAYLGWFPLSGGISTFAVFSSPFAKAADLLQHAVLPITALSLSRLGQFYLVARNSMITVMTKDYIRTAHAKGLSRLRILGAHVLHNAALPVVTRLFLSFGNVFGGAVLVENVFSYPGVGFLIRESVMLRDYVMVQGVFLFVAVTVVTMNCLADFVYRKLDPRVLDND